MGTSSDEENNNPTHTLATEGRKLQYRTLLTRIDELQSSEEYGINSLKEVGSILENANAIEQGLDQRERYENPEEIFLNSRVVSSVSDVLKNCLDVVDGGIASYNPEEFAAEILKFCKVGDVVDLKKLLPIANQIIPDVPECKSLYGSYDLISLPKAKTKEQRERKEKEIYQRKEPEKVLSLAQDEEGIEQIVKVLLEILKEAFKLNDEQPINYYSYVIDTDCFSTTVENMFHAAFLIRDGRAQIDLDGEGEPLISPVPKSRRKQFRDNGGVNCQVISSISLQEWQKFSTEGYIQQHRKRKAHESSNVIRPTP